MSIYVNKCPRCGAKEMTFDVLAQQFSCEESGWRTWFEIFCICRHCSKPTTFVVWLTDYDNRGKFNSENALVSSDASLNTYFSHGGYISQKDEMPVKPPEHWPYDILSAFNEGSKCYAIACPNAASTMFRLCIDLVSKPLLPESNDSAVAQPSKNQRSNLGARLSWLFDNQRLPENLRELASCIREDANDAAHVGNLTMSEAQDVLDFTTRLLERLITEPERIRLAQVKRDERRRQETEKSKA